MAEKDPQTAAFEVLQNVQRAINSRGTPAERVDAVKAALADEPQEEKKPAARKKRDKLEDTHTREGSDEG